MIRRGDGPLAGHKQITREYELETKGAVDAKGIQGKRGKSNHFSCKLPGKLILYLLTVVGYVD